jgi:hypothetical protein
VTEDVTGVPRVRPPEDPAPPGTWTTPAPQLEPVEPDETPTDTPAEDPSEAPDSDPEDADDTGAG